MSKFAVIMETSGEECESWYYFVKHEGNEDALDGLKSQLETVEQTTVFDDISTFDVDTEHLVSEQTVDDMILIEVNSVMYHRKFTGVMKSIDLKLKNREKDTKKLYKIDAKLGNGLIERYLSGEFVPEQHKLTGSEVYSSDDNEPLDSDTDTDSGSESDSDSGGEINEQKIPKSLRINR